MDVLAAPDERGRSGRAKACGPDPPMPGSSFASDARSDGGSKAAAHRGEHAISRKPLRGECRLIRLNLSLLACAMCILFARKARGCGQHPAFPAPSIMERDTNDASLGRDRAAGMRECVRSPDERSDIRGRSRPQLRADRRAAADRDKVH